MRATAEMEEEKEIRVVLKFDRLEGKYIHFAGEYNNKTIRVLRSYNSLEPRHLLKVDANLLQAFNFIDTSDFHSHLRSFKLIRRHERNAIADLYIHIGKRGRDGEIHAKNDGS